MTSSLFSASPSASAAKKKQKTLEKRYSTLSTVGTNVSSNSSHSFSDGGDEEQGPFEIASGKQTSGRAASTWSTTVSRIFAELGIDHASHWFVQTVTIVVASLLTFSFIHQGEKLHVQMSIMTVILVLGGFVDHTSPQLSPLIVAAGIGAFVGGQSITPNYGWLILFSLVTSVWWCLVITNTCYPLLNGFGGRLGTTTFLGFNTTFLLAMGPSGSVSWQWYCDPTFYASVKWEAMIVFASSVVWLSVGGAAYRMYLAAHGFHVNNVLVPVRLALFSMVVVNATNYECRGDMYTGFAVGSYVAMACFQRLPSLVHFAAVGVLAAAWGIVLTPVCLGFGGKAGFTAMLGHVTYAGWMETGKMITGKKKSHSGEDSDDDEEEGATSEEELVLHDDDRWGDIVTEIEV